MNEELKESLRELGASEAVIEAAGGDLVKAISLGGMGKKLIKFGELYLHDSLGSTFAIPPFDKEEFEIVFRRAGFNVPPDYLDFLEVTNGGQIGNKVKFRLNKSHRMLTQFLSFKPSILSLPQSWIYNASFKPLFFLEIATDTKDDTILITLKNRSSASQTISPGSIWHVKIGAAADQRCFLEEDILASSAYSKLANSFSESLNNLKCEEDLPHWLENKEIFKER